MNQWATVQLGKVVTLQRGFDLPYRQRKSGQIPVVSSAGVTAFHNAPMVNPPGVVTGRYGTIGEVFFINERFWPLNTTLYVRDFHGNDPLFIYYHLQRFDFATFSGKSGVPGVNRNDLHVETVTLPTSIDEQRAIATALSDVDALLDGLDRLITNKRDLKQAAMQQLLTGQTRLPGFHGEWVEKSIGELFHLSGGYTASRSELSTDGHCYLHYGDIHGATRPYVDTAADFNDIPKLNIALTKVRHSSRLEDGDVVFVDASEDDEGTSKHVVVVNKENKPFIAGLHTIVAKAKSDELVHEYRRYCFRTAAVRAQFLFYAVGTKVSGISKKNIAKLVVPIPSREEQVAIAAALSDIDFELFATEQRRDKTRYLKQAMMQELLTGRTRLVPAESTDA